MAHVGKGAKTASRAKRAGGAKAAGRAKAGNAAKRNGARSAKPRVELKRLERLLASFSRVRLLVVGDVVLDEYLWGDVDRISP